MIALVAGDVAVRRPDHVVIETASGVGYRLAVSATTLSKVPPVGEAVSLHTHLVVREDALDLYGFATEAERDLFQLLIGVPKVGPKMASSILSAGSPREIVQAIAGGDTARLTSAQNVGKAIAQRVISELREKVGAAWEPGAADLPIHVTRTADDPHGLARDSLVALGFEAAEAQRLLAVAEGETTEELVASALRSTRGAA